MARYADIILPLAQAAFTFEVDESLGVEEGSAVVVPFGAVTEKYYTGIVQRLHDQKPDFKKIKKVVRTLYARPLLTASQRKFWEWVADYYMCTTGEVMRVALPSMMKPTGGSDAELALEEFRAQSEYYVTLPARSAGDLEELIASRQRRAPKQALALAAVAKLARELNSNMVPRRLLDVQIAVLQSLARRGDILLEQRDITLEPLYKKLFTLPQLTPHQSEALAAIEASFTEKSTALLHGITGSGKTEIYIHLIARRLARGEDVLLLLPEIALTAQLLERMERIFGSRVVAYHSKLTPRRRTEIYLQINNRDGGNFIVGVRSAIFLPLKRLELIIVDEEHDASYKQNDSAPRYNARDAAVFIASHRGGNTLLGSATPSLESWMNSQSGKYGFAQLTERYGDAQEPAVIISDTIRSVKRGERKGHFNFDLLHRISERLDCSEQVILFQNRRGFAPYIECGTCGWSPRCPHCNVTLTLHKSQGRLSCHYCGYVDKIPAQCPECQSVAIKPMGFGTEKIEEQISELLPTARVARLDRDSVTSSRALGEIIGQFESGQTDVLVGTQMITKGFDFSKVTLVGILNADNMLNSPDFRAEERAFQLITQVAGRAGRRGANGEVVIQTSLPKHRVLSFVIAKDYRAFAATLLAERECFGYPPYSRILAITMKHRDRDLLHASANALWSLLHPIFGRRVQGPVPGVIDKIRDEYIVMMNLKIEMGASSQRAREILRDMISRLRQTAEYKYINIICNVDPQ
ncbi:MAG: primosomal protein N' [Rikenellaceae bacterium]